MSFKPLFPYKMLKAISGTLFHPLVDIFETRSCIQLIAVGAAVGIYWRKAKKKVNEKLGIDENRNKEVESDDIVVNKASTEDK